MHARPAFLRATFAALALACGSPAEPTPTPAPSVPAPPTAVPAPPAPDLASCALSVRVQSIGEGGEVSAPIAVRDGFVVVYGRAGATPRELGDLVAQHVRIDGTIASPTIVRPHSGNPWGVVIGSEGRVHAVVAERGGLPGLVAIDAVGESVVALDAIPDHAVRGPRGLVTTSSDGARRIVRWESGRTVELAAQTSWPTPHETLLAAGTDVDVIVARHAGGASFVALGEGAPQPVALFEESDEPESQATTASGVSVAAGPRGFAVVRTGPGYDDLEVRLADRHGVLGAPVPIATRSARAVRRYPRVAAISDGWVITYSDGIGPSLVRVDERGVVRGDVVELRSGDERGGHTDAPIAVGDGVIAVTWHVTGAMFGGAPDEASRRTGSRIALLRCEP